MHGRIAGCACGDGGAWPAGSRCRENRPAAVRAGLLRLPPLAARPGEDRQRRRPGDLSAPALYEQLNFRGRCCRLRTGRRSRSAQRTPEGPAQAGRRARRSGAGSAGARRSPDGRDPIGSAASGPACRRPTRRRPACRRPAPGRNKAAPGASRYSGSRAGRRRSARSSVAEVAPRLACRAAAGHESGRRDRRDAGAGGSRGAAARQPGGPERPSRARAAGHGRKAGLFRTAALTAQGA